MSKSTLQFIGLHLMASALFLMCLYAGSHRGWEIYYLLAGGAFVVALGTLRDVIKEVVSDLRRQ